MKLYKFSLYVRRGVNVSREVLEVEEKPKTYIERKEYYSSRISKSDIGVLSGYDNSTLYLLEDDMEKAKTIFSESLKRKIETEKIKLEYTIKSTNERIAEYEKSIAELFLVNKGYAIVETSNNPFEVLRAKKDKDTVIIYKKAKAKEHLSVMDKDVKLVNEFIYGKKIE